MNSALMPAWATPSLLARTEPPAVATPDAAAWVLQRRCALTPAQLSWVLAALVALSALVGGFFWVMGAPWVTLFSGIEVLALVAAFAFHALHAGDGERVWLHGGRVHVESTCGLTRQTNSMPASMLRVHLLQAEGVIELRGATGSIRIGRCAPDRTRQRVAAELQQACAGVRWHAETAHAHVASPPCLIPRGAPAGRNPELGGSQ